MKSSANFFAGIRRVWMCLMAGVLGASFLAAAQKPKLPRPRILEREIPYSRNSATGELQAYPAESEAPLPGAAGIIRSRVALVEVQCTVTAADGTRVRGLMRDDFRVLEDGAEQKLTSFDAATTPA